MCQRCASNAWRGLLKDILYSRSAQLRLDAFLPRAATPVPAVIVVHGGGWEAGDKVTYVTPLFEPLARAGLAWFSIDYRLTPAFKNQDQLEDVRQAIRFVRAEHKRFNIDPARIVLVGESASGQLVTQVAAKDRSLAGVVSFYGVYDFAAMVTDASPRSLLVRLFRRTVLDDEARAEMQQYSPLYQAHQDMPPVLLVNGTGERLWAQAQAFAQRLAELGVKHEVIALEGAPHGMENWEGHPEWMVYKRRMVEWIHQVARARSSRPSVLRREGSRTRLRVPYNDRHATSRRIAWSTCSTRALNQLHNIDVEEARRRVLGGDPAAVRAIDGSFALVTVDGITVRMARSLDRPMRYFLAKRHEGPALFVADRIDTLQRALEDAGFGNQFHPSYTRMVPAHYIVELALVGCPDPDPTYTRFFTPGRGTLPPDLDEIGRRYIGALADEIAKWLLGIDRRDGAQRSRSASASRAASTAARCSS